MLTLGVRSPPQTPARTPSNTVPRPTGHSPTNHGP